MSSTIYKIKQLDCKYPSTEFPVLKIDSLEVEEGAVVFFIGASGVGKSTVLETLGLMNNTIVNGTVLPGASSVFEFAIKNEKENLLAIWNKNSKKLADFRRQHFSFIFQSTNLFSTLTAYENVIITSMLQGKSRAASIQAAKEIFREILPELQGDKKITKLSGGQRQRLAFARAIAAGYSVLFADEPTGNLDWANANNLLRVLIKRIRDEHKTAIIVSHDIRLSIKYADVIVLIEKKTAENNQRRYVYGNISDESIFKKVSENSWLKNSTTALNDNDLSNYLQETLINQAR